MKLIKYGGAVTGFGEIWAILKSVIKSTFTRNWQQGEQGKLFEQELAEYLGVKHAILTSSGSCAGLLALSALELSKGGEVIIGATTFPTIFNIILQCGLTPVVVDCKVGTYGFDVAEVKKAITKKTSAIIAIHPLGNPVDMPALMDLVKGTKIKVIEDNCDGLGSEINSKKVGSFGHISITSLHAAHIVSMGVGGVVFTNDDELAAKVRMYRDWGRQADINESKNTKHQRLPKDYNPRFIYEKIGYNFQILDLQAAMGRVQLRKINKIKIERQDNFNYLYTHLPKHKQLVLPVTYLGKSIRYMAHGVSPFYFLGAQIYDWELPYTSDKLNVCWFAFPLTYMGDREKLLRYLEQNGIETRPMFAGNILKHPAYKHLKIRHGDLSQANEITKHSFWISCHPSLTNRQLKHIVKTFDEFFKSS